MNDSLMSTENAVRVVGIMVCRMSTFPYFRSLERLITLSWAVSATSSSFSGYFLTVGGTNMIMESCRCYANRINTI
jgi:hypothetical protein